MVQPFRKCLTVFQVVEHMFTFVPANPLLGIPKRNENKCLQKKLRLESSY